MARAIVTTVVYATVGPAELEAGRAYVHEAAIDGDVRHGALDERLHQRRVARTVDRRRLALDGDEGMHIGKSVVVCDEVGRKWAATVTACDGHRWQLTLTL